jgi:hypothetical protein
LGFYDGFLVACFVLGVDDRLKSRIGEEVSELKKFIASLNVGNNTQDGRPADLDMVDENIIGVEYSIAEIVHLVQSSHHITIDGLVASNDEHSDPDGGIMQQQTKMAWNARVFTWWKCMLVLRNYGISS